MLLEGSQGGPGSSCTGIARSLERHPGGGTQVPPSASATVNPLNFDDSLPAFPQSRRERTTWLRHGVRLDSFGYKPIGSFWNKHAYDFRHSPLWSMRPGCGMADPTSRVPYGPVRRATVSGVE